MVGATVEATPAIKRDSGATNLVSASFTTVANDYLTAEIQMGGSGAAPTSFTGHGVWSLIGTINSGDSRFTLAKYGCPVLVGGNSIVTVVVPDATVGITFTKTADVNPDDPTKNFKSAAGYGTALALTFDVTPTNTTITGWGTDSDGTLTPLAPNQQALSTIGYGFGGRRVTSSYDVANTDTPTATTADTKEWAVTSVELNDVAAPSYEIGTLNFTFNEGFIGVTPDPEGLMSGDTAENDGVLSYRIVTQPTNGTLTKNYISGYFEYDPDNDFIGVDSFTHELYESGVSIGIGTTYLVFAELSAGIVTGINTPFNIPISVPVQTILDEANAGDGGELQLSVVTPGVNCVSAVINGGNVDITPVDNVDGLMVVGFDVIEIGNPDPVSNVIEVTIQPIDPSQPHVYVFTVSANVDLDLTRGSNAETDSSQKGVTIV